MTTVADLAAWLEGFAPSSLAESWDNVGLLLGDPASPLSRVMTCLTVTGPTADEAIAEGAGAIVSHHPILFKATKSLRADRTDSGPTWRLARAGVAVLSPHTSFDNTEGGINDGLARRLGLVDVGPIRPSKEVGGFKVVVFAPSADRDGLLASAFEAGAGRIGAYGECSFSVSGFGTFRGDEDSNPSVGVPGRRESVRERRIELGCSADRLGPVLAALRLAHSYEEPAIDVYPLATGSGSRTAAGPGSGRVGRLAEPRTLGELAAEVARVLAAPATQFVGDPAKPVLRVAICCGAGDDFLPDAARLGADVLLTGEARFHRALEAEALGVGLILAGHHATERPGVEDLAARIADRFAGLVAWPSRSERDPLRSVPSR